MGLFASPGVRVLKWIYLAKGSHHCAAGNLRNASVCASRCLRRAGRGESACMLPPQWQTPLLHESHGGSPECRSLDGASSGVARASWALPLLSCANGCLSSQFSCSACSSGDLCRSGQSSGSPRTDGIEVAHIARPHSSEAWSSTSHLPPKLEIQRARHVSLSPFTAGD
jgi:hypothetical protein